MQHVDGQKEWAFFGFSSAEFGNIQKNPNRQLKRPMTPNQWLWGRRKSCIKLEMITWMSEKYYSKGNLTSGKATHVHINYIITISLRIKWTYTAGLSPKIMGYSWIEISSKNTFLPLLEPVRSSDFNIERRGSISLAVIVRRIESLCCNVINLMDVSSKRCFGSG